MSELNSLGGEGGGNMSEMFTSFDVNQMFFIKTA